MKKKFFDRDFHNFDKHPKCLHDIINPNYKSKVFSKLPTQEYKFYSTMLKEITNFQCLKIYIIAVILKWLLKSIQGKNVLKKLWKWEFPGGPEVKTVLPMQVAQSQSLAEEN